MKSGTQRKGIEATTLSNLFGKAVEAPARSSYQGHTMVYMVWSAVDSLIITIIGRDSVEERGGESDEGEERARAQARAGRGWTVVRRRKWA